MTAKNLYDFADLADLPADLREALETQTTDNARKYAEIVQGAAEAGFKTVNIRQVMAVAFRKFGEIPTQTTVRNYLNAAVKLKLIGKPTRASYSADTSVVVEDDEEEAAQEAAPAGAEAVDPLAGL